MSALIFAHPFIVAVIVAFPFRSATIHANILSPATISPDHTRFDANCTVHTIDPERVPDHTRFANIDVIRFTFAVSVPDHSRLDSMFIPLDKALARLEVQVISVYVASPPPLCARTYEYCPSVQRGILDFLSNSDSLIKRDAKFFLKEFCSKIRVHPNWYPGVW